MHNGCPTNCLKHLVIFNSDYYIIILQFNRSCKFCIKFNIFSKQFFFIAIFIDKMSETYSFS